ncbi:MAG TPA: YicC/YloC family endoribonuclease, partial [Vicinamibacteria bacterium]|nr:YicC/YloC family endoribonuclease [Vicinamibacteria bacterium]
MTGYARASSTNEAYEAVAEIRTVNHRYLEVRLRASGSASPAYEKRIRERVAKNLARGKVDVTLHVSALSESNQEIRVDRPLMKEFVRIVKELGDELGVESKLSAANLVAFTPAFSVRERDMGESSAADEAVDRAVSAAIESLE